MHSSIYFSIYTFFFFFSPMFPVFNISWELNLPFIYWPYCLFTFWPVNEPLSGLCCLVLALRANLKKKKKKGANTVTCRASAFLVLLSVLWLELVKKELDTKS